MTVIVLLALGLVVVGVIAFVRSRDSADAARPAPVGASGAIGDEVCRPSVQPPPAEPWIAGDPAEPEAVWNAHADELTDAIVHGEDGWVDWGDIQGMNFSQAVGRRVLTVDEVDRWAEYFRTLESQLSGMGIRFAVLVTPSKWMVSPEHLPEWAQGIRGSGPLDQLLAVEPALPIVDVRRSLRDGADVAPVFSKVNSHWTSYGAYLAWAQLADCLESLDASVGDIPVLTMTGIRLEQSSNEFVDYGVPDPAHDAAVPEFDEALKSYERTASDGRVARVQGVEPTPLDWLPATTSTPGAPDRSMLLLRDSFGSALSVYAQQAFATTTQVRHGIDMGPGAQPDVVALAREHAPDVVVLQIAARHLNFPPPW